MCSSSFLVRFRVPVGISSMSFCVSGPVLLIVAFSTASLSHLLLFFGVGLVFRLCFLLVLFPSSSSCPSCGCRFFFFHEKNCSGLHISKIARAQRCSLLAPFWLPRLRALRSASQCCENLFANFSCWLYCCFCISAFTFQSSCSLCVWYFFDFRAPDFHSFETTPSFSHLDCQH